MKQKNLFYLICTLFIFAFASCSDDDNEGRINEKELPANAISFLEQFLPNNSFISAHKRKIDGERDVYEVNLSENILASFDTNGSWNYVQSEQGLPETLKSLLSENSQKSLNEKYPGAKITALSYYGNGELFISLNNKKKFVDIDAHEGYALAEILDSEGQSAVSGKIKQFISQYLQGTIKDGVYPDILMFSGFRGNIYRLLFADQAFVDFYQDGEWFHMKDTGTTKVIQNVFIKAIPEQMLKVLTEKQANAVSTLKTITRFNYNRVYGFDLGDKNFIAVSSENEIIEPPLDKAKEYIKQGFTPEKELQYEVRTNTSNPYFLRYAFIITGQGIISLVTDVEGNMRNISAGPVTSGEGVVPLPKAVLEMLPNATTIMNYLETNYPDKEIIYITHSYSVSQDDIPENINLTMRIPNNLRTLIFDSHTGKFIKEYTVIRE